MTTLHIGICELLGASACAAAVWTLENASLPFLPVSFCAALWFIAFGGGIGLMLHGAFNILLHAFDIESL